MISNPSRGLFISFEGLDGSGKTTQIQFLKAHLLETGRNVRLLREPGGTPISEAIRKILLNPEFRNMHPLTEFLLYSASRNQLVNEVIIPELEKGVIVLCDRYLDSSIVYQGYTRNLPLKFVQEVSRQVTQGLLPDLTFILDIPVEESVRRLNPGKLDRLERESLEFRQKVRDGYLQLAREQKERCLILNGLLDREQLRTIIREKVEERLSRNEH